MSTQEQKKQEKTPVSEAPKGGSQVVDEMNALKTKGNEQFKAKNYIKAATAFGDAIKAYEKHNSPRSAAVDPVIAACYTNRALMFHFMGD